MAPVKQRDNSLESPSLIFRFTLLPISSLLWVFVRRMLLGLGQERTRAGHQRRDNRAERQIGFLLRLLPLLRLFQNWHISTTIVATNDSGRIVQKRRRTTMKETPQKY